MKARKLPSGAWICEGSYTIAKQRHRKSFTADSKIEAERLALMYSMDGSEIVKDSVAVAIETYIAQRRPVLSPSSIRSYVTMQKHLDKFHPEFMRLSVASLDTRIVQDLINDISSNHAPKTVRSYFALLTASMPSRMSILRSVVLPARKRPEYHIPSSETAQAILKAARDTDLEVPILLAIVCTMRAGEIAALRMEDIEGNMIHVCRNMVRNEFNKWTIKQPKTFSSDRYVEAPSWLIKKIKAQGYVTEMDPSRISYRFGRFLKANGLPHCRFHDLRHFSVSFLHAKGVATAYIMKRGGWNSEAILNAVYRHALDDIEKKETKRINAEFTSLLS